MENEDLSANTRNKLFVMFLGHDELPQLTEVSWGTESDQCYALLMA